MPTPKKGPRLGGSPAHQRAILANLATNLFERIGDEWLMIHHHGSPVMR